MVGKVGNFFPHKNAVHQEPGLIQSLTFAGGIKNGCLILDSSHI